jgi:hypothetical protein
MRDFIVVQQGSPSDLYHGFEGGTVLLMREVIELSTRWHGTAVNDYENSRIHGWLNNEFFNTINENIRNQVRQVRIPYRFGSATTPEPNDTVLIGLNGLQCRVFLLSAREVGADIEVAGFPADGTVLTHFAGLNHNIGEPRREATSAGGVRALWGLRSPHTAGTSAWFVGVNGSINGTAIHTGSPNRGFRPALVFPSTATLCDCAPVVTEPPVTEAPITEPPVTEPPVTEPEETTTAPPMTTDEPPYTTEPTGEVPTELSEKIEDYMAQSLFYQSSIFLILIFSGIVYFLYSVVTWFIR